MSEDGKPTAGNEAGKQGDADQKPADESYTKIRIKRALEKHAPEYEAKGRKAIIAELGLDPDDDSALDALKATVAKGASADSERTKLEKQLAKLAQERDAERAERSKLEQTISMRAVHDTIATAIGDAAIVPGKLPQVQKLLSDHFVVADGRVAVRGDDGEPANVAPQKFVAGWLAENTHFLTAPAPKGGSGSRSSSGEQRGSNGTKRISSDDELRARFEEKLREGPPPRS